MFKRVRQLRIPLAVKCELLFGAAVILVIGAALLVPWQRMEQLTEQLNEKAAAMVARHAVGQHMLAHAGAGAGGGAGSDGGSLDAATRPAREPAAIAIDGHSYAQPRLLGVVSGDMPSNVTRFELSALSRFQEDASLRFHARLDANTDTFRYAQPLRAQRSCVQCHTAIAAPQTVLASVAAPLESPAPASPDDAGEASPATPGMASADVAASGSDEPPMLLGMVSVEIPSQISTRQIVLNRVFLLTAGMLAGTVAIVIFYVVTTRLILQPVRVLQETAEKVSQGDLNIRSDINSGDEFQVLSETFNTMLINLKQSADQLRAVNKSLDLKLGQLAESNVALYESNRLKSEFLASVSHELRTPLNAILGFAELLRDQLLTSSSPSTPAAGATAPADGKLARYIQNIVVSGNNLLALINDLLDLAKIEAGRMEIRSVPLSVPDMFEGLVVLLKPMTEAKNLSIEVSVASDVPILQTDPGKLQQVLYNFLSNAIKFSPPGENIDLVADRDTEETIRISVSDRGPGIEPEKHAVIFEKFRQLDGGVTRSHSGTGLGLAISRELATLMGGSTGVYSAPGDGATFWIRLPVRIEASQQDMRGRLVLS